MKLPPKYFAPHPTDAQLQNGKLKKYDPYDLVGNISFIDLARDHIFAAAGTVHDEQTLRGAETLEQRKAYDDLFSRNCATLARGVEHWLAREYWIIEGSAFFAIVSMVTRQGTYPQENRNTRETEIQGWKNQIEAQTYINAVAVATGQMIPCPVPAMPIWSDEE